MWKSTLYIIFIVIFIRTPLYAEDVKVSQGSASISLLYQDLSKPVVDKYLGKIISQEMSFVLSDDNGDYHSVLFKTKEGESFSMNVGPELDSETMGKLKKGPPVMVKRKIVILTEAAEGEAPYYSWGLISIRCKL